MVKFRQSCCESEAPRPERIKSKKPTVCADIAKHWLEHQKKEDLTSWSMSARKIAHYQRIAFSLVSVLLAWSKSTKRSRLPKNGWKQASVLAGRNEGCYILPLLKTDVQKSPVHRQPSSRAFLLYFTLPVFLTPFLEGRSFCNYYSMIIVKYFLPPISQIGMEASNSRWNSFSLSL